MALLGLRVGLADIAALGGEVAALVVLAMAATIVSGFVFAHWGKRAPGFGALVGVGTAVCGASATLACSTVVPDYAGKDTDVAFVVVAVNALATLAMLVYPPICILLHFSPDKTGIMLGATIHDVAQVVGAGYAVSVTVGNTAVIVRLFRVFLLLPVVLGIGWYFTHRGMKHGEARAPVFGIVFLLLCILNSIVPTAPSLIPIYAPIKGVLIEASGWGLWRRRSPPCFLSDISGWSLSLDRRPPPRADMHPLARLLAAVAVLFLAKCRIGAAPASATGPPCAIARSRPHGDGGAIPKPRARNSTDTGPLDDSASVASSVRFTIETVLSLRQG